MEPRNHTLRVLTEIGDAVRSTNERAEQTNERLEELGETLSRRIVESELRTATAITAITARLEKRTAILHEAVDLRPRVERCEDDIAELKRKVR